MNNASLPHGLTEDIWTSVFNILSLKHQYSLAQTCRALKNIFDTRAYSDTGSAFTVVDTTTGWINTCKNYWYPSRTQDMHDKMESFCTKIATNRIGGEISFSFNTIKEYDLFCKSCVTNKYITGLKFINCGITDAFIPKLSPLSVLPLISFDLSNNNITYEGAAAVLTLHPQLLYFNISDNPIAKHVKFKSVENSFFMVSGEATHEELKILGTKIKSLKCLSMNECELWDNHVEWLVDFLRSNKYLTALHLAKNYIHNTKADLIDAADKPGSPLKIIEVSGKYRINLYTTRNNLTVIV